MRILLEKRTSSSSSTRRAWKTEILWTRVKPYFKSLYLFIICDLEVCVMMIMILDCVYYVCVCSIPINMDWIRLVCVKLRI